MFGQLQYDIRPDLEASAALRFDSDTAEDHNLVPTDARTQYIDFTGPPYTGGAPLNPGLDPALNPAGISNKSKTFDQFEPKVSLRWTASPEWSLYGDWGVGFKSGGFNNAGSAATINAFINPVRTAAGYSPVDISDEYKKEVSTQGELGVKGRLLDGKLTLDAAVYDTNVQNMQFFEFFVGPAISTRYRWTAPSSAASTRRRPTSRSARLRPTSILGSIRTACAPIRSGTSRPTPHNIPGTSPPNTTGRCSAT